MREYVETDITVAVNRVPTCPVCKHWLTFPFIPMSSRSQDASGYSMTRYKQWNAQRKGYNREPNSPESDLTNTSSTEMNSSSMRRAIRSQYRRMQEVIAALGVCVCVSSVWTATENPPGTRQSLIRANKGGRFASPNNLIILISRFRWSAAGPQCARFVVIARFYASDTQVTRRVWHPRSSCTVAQRSPVQRCSATQETTIILVHCSDSESEADERPSQCE